MNIPSLVAQRGAELQAHFEQRVNNETQWLYDYLGDTERSAETLKAAFPYILADKAIGSVQNRIYCPDNQNNLLPRLTGVGRANPHYVVNIPCFADSDATKTFAKAANVVALIRSQAFAETDRASYALVRKRIAVVLGMNRPKSLDAARNRNFIKRLEKQAPALVGLSCRMIGFLWDPKWNLKPEIERKILSEVRAYKLIKVLRPKEASRLRIALEGQKGTNSAIRSQIPYQAIREKIFRSQETKAFFEVFTDDAREVYLSTLDDDSIALRSERGLFSTYDAMIAAHIARTNKNPELLSTGYCLKSAEDQILRFAVDMDRAVRVATAKHIPLGPYYAEPNILFRIQKQLYRRGKYSFMGTGKSLESRRFIQNTQKAGVLLDGTTVVSSYKNPLVTETPDRMKTLKSQRLKTVTGLNVKQKQVLQTLRGISQTHVFPKQWADNLYIALPFKAKKVTDATGALMGVYNSFHPISLIMGWNSVAGKYRKANFDIVMDIYKRHAKALKAVFLDPSSYQRELVAFLGQIEEGKKEICRLFFKTQSDIFLIKCQELEKLGLEKEWMEKVVLAAHDSGLAIEKSLRSL